MTIRQIPVPYQHELERDLTWVEMSEVAQGRSEILSGAGISSFPTFIHITEREMKGGRLIQAQDRNSASG
jgi:hypothetical protein